MADGKLYQFQAGGEACGVCSGMDGQISEGGMGLPHDGCMCQVVPVDADGAVVGGDVVAQAEQVFAIMARVLAAAGASAADVVKVTVYLLDIRDRPRINPVRQAFFGETRPASTLVEVSRLAIPGARLEIEAIAHLP